MAASLDRAALFADRSRTGIDLSVAYCDLMDRWLAALYRDASSGADGVALVAVGGYGRGELAPHSDLDVVLLHRDVKGIGVIAERVWYPVWDEGLKLGHSVRTVKEALTLAADDLDTATSLVTIRHLAGDEDLTAELTAKALASWRKRAKTWLVAMSERVSARHAQYGEVAFLLEPDLKEGRGGLRDVHAIRWAELAQKVMLEGDDASLAANHDVLFAARIELHRRLSRPDDRLLLEEQDAVAATLGYEDADVMMSVVSKAARAIAWTSDEVWERVDASTKSSFGWRSTKDRELASGITLHEGRVSLARDADPAHDQLLVLRAAVAAAQADARFDRTSLDRLADESPSSPLVWTDETRRLFAALLLAGRPAIHVIETLDQRGIFTRILPEWEPVRSKPQRNAYHRFTVDRHLCETAANAATLIDRVDRPDLLVVGAFFHDIGKGYPGDHVDVGIDVVAAMATRMGYDANDSQMLQLMVRYHLLLPDVATRRDLSDDSTIRWVAEQVGSMEALQLLDALTEADSLATGSAAWSDWKAGLVRQLVARTAHVLVGGTQAEVTGAVFPTPEQSLLMADGQRILSGEGDHLTVISPDRPGLFSRAAAALALNGLDVLEAAAYSNDAGMAIEVFRVEPRQGATIRWARVLEDVERALDGRVALAARLQERAKLYPNKTRDPRPPSPPTVTFDNRVSDSATVVEVRAPDRIGVLYRITRAIAEVDLDIRSAKVQTHGVDVVDSFYLRDRDGRKVTDPDYLIEIERSILSAL
ncbi:MAG: [protein-PII] uridylyltransferase [Actinomycetes bacterium]